MQRSIQLLNQGFESSSSKTPEFKSFARKFKNDLSKEVSKVGAKIASYNVGHFYVSGFIQLPSGNLLYFSLPDVREWSMYSNHFGQLLVRTAKHLKDFTGGNNTYCSLDEIEGHISYFK
jgi:hypothetical protein